MLNRFPNTMKAAEAFAAQHPDIRGFAINVNEHGEPRMSLTFLFAGGWTARLVITEQDEDSPRVLVHTFNKLGRHVEQNRSHSRSSWLRPHQAEPAFA